MTVLTKVEQLDQLMGFYFFFVCAWRIDAFDVHRARQVFTEDNITETQTWHAVIVGKCHQNETEQKAVEPH